jgi:molybdate transport system substrate-binding protein
MRILRLSLVLLLALTLASTAVADEITLAAAADLSFAFQDIAARFEKESGHTVKLSFGSSGNFFSQIQNGAPFDMFFSADIDYPKKLEAVGLGEPGTLYEYARGKIVLWVLKDSKIDVSRGLATLLDPSIRKIAIANPQHAPYGRAAVAAMQHEKVYDKLEDKLVFGENISQAAHFVESGNADAGILALSLAVAPALKEKGKYFEIPASDYPPIEQGCIILKSSQKKELARQFLAFLKKPEIVALMRNYGFAVPEQSAEGAPRK